MTKVKLFIFAYILFSVVEVNAQTNFVPGFIVNDEGDTVRGFVEARSESRNHRICTFKAKLDGEAIQYGPDELFAYGLGDSELYESYFLKDVRGNDVSGFFKVLVIGKLSLLQLHSSYFVKDQEKKVSDITKRREDVAELKVRADLYGLGQLKNLMQDCPEMGATLDTQYKTSPDYVGIFKKYNRCVGVTPRETDKALVKMRVSLGVLVAPALTSITFQLGEKVTVGQSYWTTGGAFASFFFPRLNEKVNIVLEGVYGKFDGYGFYTDGTSNNDIYVKYSYLRIPVLVRYSSKRFFLDFGMQNQLILNQSMQWRKETISGQTVSTSDVPMQPLNSSTIGLLGGVGVINRIVGRVVRTSVRYGVINTGTDNKNPRSQTLELAVSFQLIN